MPDCTGSEMIHRFHEYFNGKVASDWLRQKIEKIESHRGATLRALTEPLEEAVDDLAFKLAELREEPAHKTQSLLRHTENSVITALVLRWGIVTEYFQKHKEDRFPCSDNLGQFILDYLTNHWRWIKEQPDN